MNAETKVHTGLNAALIRAQSELHAPAKNREVTVKSEKGSYKFQYATLDEIVERVLRPVLPKHGLWFTQFYADGLMVTRILHDSGDHLDAGVPMPNIPTAPQQAGSVLTYFKRYSLCAAFGLVAEEDDDANVASGNSYVPANRTPVAGKVDEDQFRTLQSAVDRTGADLARFCKYFQVASLKDVPANRFKEALDALEAKAKRKEPVNA